MHTKNFIRKHPKHGHITHVLCKGCGTVIRELVPGGDPIQSRKVDGTIVRDMPMILDVKAHYTEVELLMDDKSRHITNTCSTCATNTDLSFWDAMHQTDMDEQGNRHNTTRMRDVIGVKLYKGD